MSSGMTSEQVEAIVLKELVGFNLIKILQGRRRSKALYIKCKTDSSEIKEIGFAIIRALPKEWCLISAYYGYRTGVATYMIGYRNEL